MEVKLAVGNAVEMFLHLRNHMSDLTLFLKEKNPYYFHHYFMITNLVENWSLENRGICPKEGEWDETPVHTSIKLPCYGVFQLGYRERHCFEQNRHAFWSAEDTSHCTGPISERFSVVRISFQSGKRRTYEIHDWLNELADELNCENIEAMVEMAFDENMNFTRVFKHCKLVDEELEVRFMSKQEITLDWIRFFAFLAPIRRIEVLTEGYVGRLKYELEFSKVPKRDCNTQSYLFCNRQDVIKGMYCNYRMIATKVAII